MSEQEAQIKSKWMHLFLQAVRGKQLGNFKAHPYWVTPKQ